MVYIRKNDDIQLSAFVINGQFIHLYENRERELFVKSLSPITDVCLNYKTGGWELCVATSDCVYRVMETDVGKGQCRQQSEIDNASISNQEIFDDLLDDNTVHPFPGILHESAEAFIILETQFCIVQEDCVIVCIAVCDEYLWCVTQRDNNFCLSGYRLTSSNPSEIKINLSPIITYHLNFHCKYNNDITKCRVYLVVSETYSKLHNLAASSCVVISTRTLSSLFGKKAALLDAPILLFAGPDGSIYFRQLAEQDMNGSDGWQIFCETGNSVSYITSITLDKAEHEDTDPLFPTLCLQDDLATDAMLICCEMGKVVVAAEDQTGHANYGTIAVQGPVLSWSCDGKHLFHCSEALILRTTISRDDGDRDDQKGESLFSNQTELVHNISVSDVVHVSGPLKPDNCLLCYTTNGDTIVLETHPTDLSQNPRSLKMKELLVGLDYNSKRRECVQNQQECLNAFLQQLNMASHLVSENKMESASKLIKSQCRVESYKNGYSREYHLSVVLTNLSAFKLSSNWSLGILLTLNSQSKTETESHDFRLSNGFKDKSDFQVKIPLSKQFTMSNGFKVVLHLVLNFDKSFLTSSSPVPLSIPLFLSSHTIDALCFIEEDSCCPKHCVSLDEALKRLAEDRIPGCSSRPCGTETWSNKVYSAEVFLSSSSLPRDLLSGNFLSEKILEFLLQDSDISRESVQHGQGQFVDPGGNSLSLTVKEKTESSLTVSIRSNSLSLIAKCRMAVVNRLQVNASDIPPCPRKHVHKFLQQMEKVREFLQTIQDSCSENSNLKAETIQSVCLLYEKLRQTKLQTVDT